MAVSVTNSVSPSAFTRTIVAGENPTHILQLTDQVVILNISAGKTATIVLPESRAYLDYQQKAGNATRGNIQLCINGTMDSKVIIAAADGDSINTGATKTLDAATTVLECASYGAWFGTGLS